MLRRYLILHPAVLQKFCFRTMQCQTMKLMARLVPLRRMGEQMCGLMQLRANYSGNTPFQHLSTTTQSRGDVDRTRKLR
jgi:hypothetical protein